MPKESLGWPALAFCFALQEPAHALAASAAIWPVAEGGNGHCYQFVDDTVTWTEANDAANAALGHLATISSAGENDFVADIAHSNWIWIGLTDRAVEGTFQWVTGEPLLYTNWTDGEPNDSHDAGPDGEDFVYMHYNGASFGTWNDAPNDNSGQDTIRYVIEFDADLDLDGVADRCQGPCLNELLFPSGDPVADVESLVECLLGMLSDP
jgi:hypothetical protein